MKRSFLFAIAVFVLTLSSCSTQVHFVAWNMEHLAENVGEGCLPREEADYAQMREFAQTMKADVVALQEVESAKAVARVFPEEDWNIIISNRPASRSYDCRGNGQKSTQQRVGLAVRKGVKYVAEESFEELALDREGLRYGVVAKIIRGKDTVEVMSVHLKSGCFVEDYSASDRRACETFEKQVPVLDAWMEERLKAGKPFVVLGDFNHRIANPENRFWQELTELDGQPVVLGNSMKDLKGCHPRYPEPIDHILMGAGAEKMQVQGSETVHYFPGKSGEMTQDDMLSDHCPIGVTLKF